MNVARLLFVVAVAGLLVEGPPSLGGGAPRSPALGLPDEVLRPPVAIRPAGRTLRPLPLQRMPAAGGVRQAAPGPSVRARRIGPRRRRVRRDAPPLHAGATPPLAPPARARLPPSPVVGEFGP